MQFSIGRRWRKWIVVSVLILITCLCFGYRYYVYKARLRSMVYHPILPLAQRRMKKGGIFVNVTATKSSLPGIQKNIYLPDELLESMAMHQIESRFYSYLEHKFVICHDNRRLGNQHEGGWNVCLSPPFTVSKPCLVYSFGIGGDWRFEDDMFDLYKCKVMAFDHSMGIEEHNRTEGIWFRPIGLGTSERQNDRQKHWKLKPFEKILEEDQNTQAIIDYLKFDIEFMEWNVLKDLFGSNKPLSNVKQLGFEIHLLDPSKNDTSYKSVTRQDFMDKHKILKLVESAGFRRFDFRSNPFCTYLSPISAQSQSGCYELFYLNMKFVRDEHLRSSYALDT